MAEKNIYEVVMPKLGMIMTEATLLAWHKQDGEPVKAGETLFELESDKSVVEIEAPTSGVLNILVPAGELVPVMTPVANIQTDAKVRPSQKKDEAPAALAQSKGGAAAPVRTGGTAAGVRATPKARVMARNAGLSLAGMTGSGPRGMVTTADLAKAPQAAAADATPVARKLAADLGQPLSGIAGSGPGGRITREDVSRAVRASLAGGGTPAAVKKLPLRGLRAVIAERLTEGWQQRPQVTLTTEIDASALVEKRGQLNAGGGQKRSYNTFLVLAAAKTLKEQPNVNVQLTETGLQELAEINIGLAVDTERGLLVPIVRDPLSMTISALDAAIADLAGRTLAGEALPDELTGGTFTITNLGAFGIDAFTPIINPPEAAILGVGRIAPRPYVVDGELTVRHTLTLSLSFDHRLIDGAPAARFLQRVAELLEKPEELLD